MRSRSLRPLLLKMRLIAEISRAGRLGSALKCSWMVLGGVAYTRWSQFMAT